LDVIISFHVVKEENANASFHANTAQQLSPITQLYVTIVHSEP